MPAVRETQTAQISDIAREVTQEILARMRKGFYYKDQYRHDPIVWDIGNGWCEEWGKLLIKRYHEINKEHQCPFCPWADWYEKEYTDENGEPYIADHYVVEFRGKYYDADRPEGVDNVWDLPMWEQTERPVE